VILSGDLSKINDRLVSVQSQNEEERPSCLNTRSVQKSILATLSSQYKVKRRNNNPLISVQGQKEEERPSRLSRRSIQKSILTTLSSQYKVKKRNN